MFEQEGLFVGWLVGDFNLVVSLAFPLFAPVGFV